MNLIHVSGSWSILENIYFKRWDQVPKTVEIWHTLARWCTSNHPLTAQYAQALFAKVLATVRERNDRWVELAVRVYGLPENDLRDYITHGDDSVSLAVLIHLARKTFRSDLHLTRNAFRSDLHWDVLGAFAQIDIRNTLSRLQHEFCTLWNEIVKGTRNRGHSSIPICILREIRHHYISLHQGINPLYNVLCSSPEDPVLFNGGSYPSCDIISHRPDVCPDLGPDLSPDFNPDFGPDINLSLISHVPVPFFTLPPHSPDDWSHHSTSDGRIVSWRASIITGHPPPSHLTKPSEIGDSFQAPTATSPALSLHTSPRSTYASPSATVAVALQNISPAATLPHPQEGTMHQDIFISGAEPDILSIVSMPLVLNSTTPSRSADSAALPRLRARGLVNTGSMCFANAVLQLLVHAPPFCDLIRELGNLKGQRGAWVLEETGSATPLADATLRFFEEFTFKEEEPPSPPPQQVAGGKPREDEDATKGYNASFEPMYMYDALKEKRQLRTFLVRSSS